MVLIRNGGDYVDRIGNDLVREFFSGIEEDIFGIARIIKKYKIVGFGHSHYMYLDELLEDNPLADPSLEDVDTFEKARRRVREQFNREDFDEGVKIVALKYIDTLYFSPAYVLDEP
jgi:hypothetical protein